MKTLKDFPCPCRYDILQANELINSCDFQRWKQDFEVEHKFLVAMDERVEEKQGEYGDSWKIANIDFLTERVQQNYKEWLDSLFKDETSWERRKLVDLANLCRFLWERLGEEK